MTKRYPGTTALAGVDFELAGGEIHALVGENGAGKSTLVRVLTGVAVPTEGALAIDDMPLELQAPADASARGISVAHQDSWLFANLRVWECLFAGGSAGDGSWVHRDQCVARSEEVFRRLGVAVDVSARVKDLSLTERKLTEIAGALLADAHFVLLDEPTAALDANESLRLGQIIRRLASEGVGVLLVSHYLEEVLALADRVTVLRDGRRVAGYSRGQFTEEDLIEAMIGAPPSSVGGSTREVAYGQNTQPALTVTGLRLHVGAAPLTFTAHRGEVVGVVGLIGSGTQVLLAGLAGALQQPGLRAHLNGVPARRWNRARAARLGVGYLSSDRKRAGILPDLEVCENVAIGSLSTFESLGFLRRHRVRDIADAICRELDVRLQDVRQSMSTLSGGNQQKALIGRWSGSDTRILVIDEPTQGVDVGARNDIHRHLRSLADEGGTVVFSSSDLAEVLALADRVVVLRKGEIEAEVSGDSLSSLSRHDLLSIVTGLNREDEWMMW